MSDHGRGPFAQWGRLLAIFTAFLSVHLVVKIAEAAATWNTEKIEDETEDCVRVYDRGASMVYVDNECDEPLEITATSCDPEVCEQKTFEVEYSEALDTWEIGASALDFEDGEKLETTFDVTRGDNSIGTITWVGEAQESEAAGGCGCPALVAPPACC